MIEKLKQFLEELPDDIEVMNITVRLYTNFNNEPVKELARRHGATVNIEGESAEVIWGEEIPPF